MRTGLGLLRRSGPSARSIVRRTGKSCTGGALQHLPLHGHQKVKYNFVCVSVMKLHVYQLLVLKIFCTYCGSEKLTENAMFGQMTQKSLKIGNERLRMVSVSLISVIGFE